MIPLGGRRTHPGLSAATAAASVLLLLGLVTPLLGPEPTVWDDAYMFVRYAGNLLAEGRLCWNPGGEPTYGLTSPLFLAAVVPVRALVTAEPLRAALLSSLLSGVAFLALLAALVRRSLGGPPLLRRIVIFLVALALGGGSRMLGAHLASGMDTTFAMTFLAGYLLVGRRHESAPSRATTLAMGLLGGIAYGVRPDLCLYALLVPLAMLALAPGPAERRSAAAVLGTTSLLTGAAVAAAWGYFGTPLPLPFWVKGTRYYGDVMYELYEPVPLKMLTAFARAYAPLLVPIAAGVWAGLRRTRWRPSGFEAGVLLATAAFVAYYVFFALQIMPMEARFYHPALPALVLLACRGAVAFHAALPEATAERLARALGREPSVARRVVVPLALAAALLPAGIAVSRGLAAGLRGNGFRLAPLDARESYRALARDWFGLEAFSRLPDDLVIATTEVGHVAALNPGKRIVDLSGLNDTALARGRLSLEDLLRDRLPDLIYVPHEDYKPLVDGMLGHPLFRSGYEYFPPSVLGTVEVRAGAGTRREPYWLGIALRRDGPHHAAMREVVADLAPGAAPVLPRASDPGPRVGAGPGPP